MCNFCSEACHNHAHKTMTISDVWDRVQELGLQKRSKIESHMSSINVESNDETVRTESIDHVSYTWLYRRHLEKF